MATVFKQPIGWLVTMRPVPECLQRRYQIMDALVDDLSSELSNQTGKPDIQDDYGIKLMCKFWNTLKEDPNTDLQSAIQKSMSLNTKDSGLFRPHNITCYQMGKNASKPEKGGCCQINELEQESEITSPLIQKVKDLKEKVSHTKMTCCKTSELMGVQKQVNDQIAELEKKELEEVKLMKEADVMWKKMEEQYKQKISEAYQKQGQILKHLYEVETSAGKWKKNKKDLEEQLTNVEKCIKETRNKHQKKTNDLKILTVEAADLEKKIASNTKDLLHLTEALKSKRKSFDHHMKTIIEDRKKLQLSKKHKEELKNQKFEQGNECVNEAREELAKLCRVLLKKKIENENLRLEADALEEEVESLKTSCVPCGEKGLIKEQNLKSEIEKCQNKIAKNKLKCIKCNEYTDTMDLGKYCTDCPRCQEKKDTCIVSGDKCNELTNNCVCVTIKIRFMNNVLENMQALLERQINTIPGKAVATKVLECLTHSTNGKLDFETRKTLQEFILASVKTNLNLTIIGGAVKTRCEMDPDTYKELMQCLKHIKTKKPEKIDKGTDSRKEPCAHWGGTKECNCPKGPKDCICKKKSLKAPSDPSPRAQLAEDKKDIGELSICAHKDKTPCGPQCTKPDAAKINKKFWKPKPCGGEQCTFNKNVRAAQCDLGTDCSYKTSLGNKACQNAPIDQTLCDCRYDACDCHTTAHYLESEMIEEVFLYKE